MLSAKTDKSATAKLVAFATNLDSGPGLRQLELKRLRRLPAPGRDNLRRVGVVIDPVWAGEVSAAFSKN
jgi:hypothetical protein